MPFWTHQFVSEMSLAVYVWYCKQTDHGERLWSWNHSYWLLHSNLLTFEVSEWKKILVSDMQACHSADKLKCIGIKKKKKLFLTLQFKSFKCLFEF